MKAHWIALAVGVSTAGAHAALDNAAAEAMMKKDGCAACHEVDKKLIGPRSRTLPPSTRATRMRHAMLRDKVKKGGTHVWGERGHAAERPCLPTPTSRSMVDWILTLEEVSRVRATRQRRRRHGVTALSMRANLSIRRAIATRTLRTGPITQPGNTAIATTASRQRKLAPSTARPYGDRCATDGTRAHEQILDHPQVEVDADVAGDQAQHRVGRVAGGEHVPEDQEFGDESRERRDAGERQHRDGDHHGRERARAGTAP